MNSGVGRARIGQWYSRLDKGQVFQVTGLDDSSRTVEIQTFDGDLDEIDQEAWDRLPLSFAEPPEDWTGPVDDVEVDDLGYSDTEMSAKDWEEPVEPLRVESEDRDVARDDDEREPDDEGLSDEELLLNDPVVRERMGWTKPTST
ncbi:MAG TPA: DUF6763 family protein [Steroidobacteraceae bacterium]|nr:DUF6763 family protein [Steroidobacteraceae bacterium]